MGVSIKNKNKKQKPYKQKTQQITLENKRIKTRYLGGGFF